MAGPRFWPVGIFGKSAEKKRRRVKSQRHESPSAGISTKSGPADVARRDGSRVGTRMPPRPRKSESVGSRPSPLKIWNIMTENVTQRGHADFDGSPYDMSCLRLVGQRCLLKPKAVFLTNRNSPNAPTPPPPPPAPTQNTPPHPPDRRRPAAPPRRRDEPDRTSPHQKSRHRMWAELPPRAARDTAGALRLDGEQHENRRQRPNRQFHILAAYKCTCARDAHVHARTRKHEHSAGRCIGCGTSALWAWGGGLLH